MTDALGKRAEQKKPVKRSNPGIRSEPKNAEQPTCVERAKAVKEPTNAKRCAGNGNNLKSARDARGMCARAEGVYLNDEIIRYENAQSKPSSLCDRWCEPVVPVKINEYEKGKSQGR